jgi:hypothetical protein
MSSYLHDLRPDIAFEVYELICVFLATSLCHVYLGMALYDVLGVALISVICRVVLVVA